MSILIAWTRLRTSSGAQPDEGWRSTNSSCCEHDIAFLKGDQAAMDRAVARARERSGGDTWISNKEAFAHAYFGHLQ